MLRLVSSPLRSSVGCIPLTIPCLHALLLYTGEASSLARPQTNYVCDVTTIIGGNEVHGDSAGSSIVKMRGSGPGKVISETHLHVGKTWGQSTKLPDRELCSCEGFLVGAPKGTRKRELLDTSLMVHTTTIGFANREDKIT